jgi:predicted sulfurtransferase
LLHEVDSQNQAGASFLFQKGFMTKINNRPKNHSLSDASGHEISQNRLQSIKANEEKVSVALAQKLSKLREKREGKLQKNTALRKFL